MKEAIVLAGGLGSRLRQIVSGLPKPMAPVAGRPFLEILLTVLAGKGFRRIVLSLGYMSEKVIAHFGDSFADMLLVYEVEEIPLGTGGAIRRAMLKCKGDHVFVFNGDTYLDLEVPEVETLWQKHKEPIIVAREVADTSRYGCLEVEKGRIVSFAEISSTGSGMINAGCYVLPICILNEFSAGQQFSFELDYLVPAVKREQFQLFVTTGHFIDIGVPVDYARAQIELAKICQ